MKWSVEYSSVWDLQRKLRAVALALDLAVSLMEVFEPAFVLHRANGVLFGHSMAMDLA
jgi:hypothetical protein